MFGMLGMLSVLAELQRELIAANTRDGLAAARARGRTGGRRPALSRDQVEIAQGLYDAGEKTVQQIADIIKVPRTTVYGHPRPHQEPTAPAHGNGRCEELRTVSAGFPSRVSHGLSDFPGLSRKAVRLIAYGGRSRVPMYPPAAVRELVANALIHQDFAIAGAGPVVELFSDRLEVTNPGSPLVEPLRFVDFPPRSKNEAVASLMRRAGICEERGSGWDKIDKAVEVFQLPAPRIDILGESLRVTLFAHHSLTTMDRENRIRAVYLHSVLRFVTNEATTNTSVRQRFSISECSAAQASRLLREALDEGMIKKQSDAASRRHTTYVPVWA